MKITWKNDKHTKRKKIFKMNILSVGLILSLGIINGDAEIENRVIKYFNSDIQKVFDLKWQKYKKPLEDAIQEVIKETFGEQGMNVYIRKTPNSYRLSKGFLVNDNILYVLFKDLYLSRFPRLRSPKVSLELSSHVLRVAADVSRIIVDADYLLFRNLTDVVYGPFDPYKTSPFALEQVKHVGQATIVLEGCSLSGLAIASLHGQSVHLGHDSFRLVNCKFHLEISTRGSDSPPVIAPYFSQQQGAEIELLLLTAIKEELMPKLQGAMFSYVNTSVIFDEDLSKLRQQQQAIFKSTLAFITRVVTHLNLLIAKGTNGGVKKMDDFMFSCTDKYHGGLQDTRVFISNVSVSGLDSVYSAQSGGPYKGPNINMADTIRLAAVQVVGNIELDINKTEYIYAFYGEVQDVAIYCSIDIQMPMKNKFTVVGWRNAEIQVPDCYTCANDPKALITGFLLNQLPKFVENLISGYFTRAMQLAEETEDVDLDPKENPVEKSISYENSDLTGSDDNGHQSQDQECIDDNEGKQNEDDVGIVGDTDVTQKDSTVYRNSDKGDVPDHDYDSALNNDQQAYQEIDRSVKGEYIRSDENSSDQIEATVDNGSDENSVSDYRRRQNVGSLKQKISPSPNAHR